MAKVDKLNAPLLVIGLGGTGADGVLRIKQAFKERFNLDIAGDVELDKPPRTAYLVLDTDEKVMQKYWLTSKLDNDKEFCSLKANFTFLLDQAGGMLGGNLNVWEKKWLQNDFYENPEVRAAAAVDGAGTYRQLARLAVFRQADTLVSRFTTLLDALRSVNPGDPPGARTVKVVIVNGISGGTGSGTFLDVAYLLRYAAAQKAIQLDIDLYAVMPDVTIQHHARGDTNKTNIYSVNGFAALKELDYWMDYDRRQPIKNRNEDFIVQYSANLTSVPWNSKPFNAVTLLTATNAAGALLTDAYNVVLDSVAETLTFMMATEVQTAANDVWNDKNLGNMATAGDSFSFQSARSNEFALSRQVPKPYPRSYGYRAIGTFSNGTQNATKRILENQLVFQDVHQFMVANNHQPVMGGMEPEAFFRDFWDSDALQKLLNDYIAATQYDQGNESMFADTGVWSARAVKAMELSETQIGHLLDVHKQNVTQQVSDLKPTWLTTAITRFNEVAGAYLMEHGPRALQTMLSHTEHGFLAKLALKKTERTRSKEETVTQLDNAIEQATSTLRRFELPNLVNLLGARAEVRYADYLAAASSVYALAQEKGQYELTEYMAKELYEHIRRNVLGAGLDYVQKALIQLKDAYEASANNLKDGALPAAAGAAAQTLGAQIRTQYYKDAHDLQLRSAVMECVCSTALNTIINANEEKAVSRLAEAAQKAVDLVFLDINTQTMDALLQAHAGNAPGAVRNYTQGTLAPQLSNGAQVHFELIPQYNSGLTKDNSVVQGYISIPQTQTDVREGIKDFVQNSHQYSGIVFKNSAIDDQVFWQQIASCIPLCAYAALSRYEQIYNKNDQYGKHLFDMSETMLAVHQLTRSAQWCWSLLPSPVPWFMQEGWSKDAWLGSDLHKKLERAEQVGLIRIVTVKDKKTAFVCMPQIGDSPASGKDIEGLLSSVLQIANRRDRLQALRDLQEKLHSGVPVELQLDSLEPKINALHVPMNLATEAAAPVGNSARKMADDTCLREVVYGELVRRPLLVDLLNEQAAAMEKVDGAVHQIQNEGDTSQLIADLLVYGFVKTDELRRKVLFLENGEFTDPDGTEHLLMRIRTASGQLESVRQHLETVTFTRDEASRLPMIWLLLKWYEAHAVGDAQEYPFRDLKNALNDKKAEDEQRSEEDLIKAMKAYCVTADTVEAAIENAITSVNRNSDMDRDERERIRVGLTALKSSVENVVFTWRNLN